MTLDTAVSKALYLGNGTARQFPLDFKVWDASELLISVSGKGREVLDVTAQCDIRLTDSGGIVTYPREGAPLPEGCTLSIVRNMPFTQGIDLVSASRFDPQVIEDGLDQATAERQQLLEQLSRAVILPPTSRESPQQVVENVYAARDEAGQSANRAEASQAAAADCAARACDCADAAATEADRAKSEADRAQNLANIGPATPDRLGMVRIGQGIDVDENGVISTEPVTVATTDAPGIVQVGAGLEVTSLAESVEGAEPVTPGILSLGAHASENPQDYGKGDFQFFGHVKITDNFEEESAAKDGVAISAKGVKAAWDRIMGIKTETVLTTSGSWTVPETATYSITCVGGGGNGGYGGKGYFNNDSEDCSYWGGHGGGGGGGGGSGRVVTLDVALEKNDVIPITIGGSGGGTTSFGSYLSAVGGGNGGTGQSPSCNNYTRGGGSAGISHGGAASPGGAGVYNREYVGSGGSGGLGGLSFDAEYGHGGNGGVGGKGSLNNNGGGAPASGIQGCIRINLA